MSNDTKIMKATVNGQVEYRVYRYGELVGTFEFMRNARLFANAEQMFKDLTTIQRVYGQDIKTYSEHLSASIINTLTDIS